MTSMPPLTSLTVARAADLADHDWQPVAGCPGVEYTELWCGGDFAHSLIRYTPTHGLLGTRTTGRTTTCGSCPAPWPGAASRPGRTW